MATLSVLLIDDHAMFRAGLAQLLLMKWPDAVLAQAGSVEQALQLGGDGVQVVLLDLKLHGSSGLDGISAVRARWPQAAVVMLSSQDAVETQQLAISRGAAAFVSKAETAERITDVIASLASGEASDVRAGRSVARARHLTPRQREVLGLLHQGLPNKLIARRLDLSDHTVRRHLQDIFEFFGVDSRAEALIAARLHGLVE